MTQLLTLTTTKKFPPQAVERDQHRSELTDRDTKLAAREADIQGLKNDLKQAEARIDLMLGDIADLKKGLSQKEAAIVELENKTASLEQALRAKESDYDELMRIDAEKIKDREGQIATLRSDVSNNENRNKRLKEDISQLGRVTCIIHH